jgi:hypothetical protein
MDVHCRSNAGNRPIREEASLKTDGEHKVCVLRG